MSDKLPRYTTVEQLEAAFQGELEKLPPGERAALLRRLDSIEVTDEELDRFNREHPGFSAQVMRLARSKCRL